MEQCYVINHNATSITNTIIMNLMGFFTEPSINAIWCDNVPLQVSCSTQFRIALKVISQEIVLCSTIWVPVQWKPKEPYRVQPSTFTSKSVKFDSTRLVC